MVEKHVLMHLDNNLKRESIVNWPALGGGRSLCLPGVLVTAAFVCRGVLVIATVIIANTLMQGSHGCHWQTKFGLNIIHEDNLSLTLGCKVLVTRIVVFEMTTLLLGPEQCSGKLSTLNVWMWPITPQWHLKWSWYCMPGRNQVTYLCMNVYEWMVSWFPLPLVI